MMHEYQWAVDKLGPTAITARVTDLYGRIIVRDLSPKQAEMIVDLHNKQVSNMLNLRGHGRLDLFMAAAIQGACASYTSDTKWSPEKLTKEAAIIAKAAIAELEK